MNWTVNFTNQIVREEYDHCEHLKVGDVAPYVVGEQDSFGPVARYASCAACWEADQKAAAEELEFCYDCGQEKPMKEINEWRCFDFYAPQGDEPLMICKTCWDAPKHVERRKRDREQYENEMGWDD